jgi:hypothetical protein
MGQHLTGERAAVFAEGHLLADAVSVAAGSRCRRDQRTWRWWGPGWLKPFQRSILAYAVPTRRVELLAAAVLGARKERRMQGGRRRRRPLSPLVRQAFGYAPL